MMTNAKAEIARPANSPVRAAAALPGAGLAAGLAALAGATCCALPLALAMAGLGGAWLANLAVLVVFRPYIIATALVIVGAGWLVALRRRTRPRVYVLLCLATAALGAAIAMTAYEPQVTRYMVSLWRAQ